MCLPYFVHTFDDDLSRPLCVAWNPDQDQKHCIFVNNLVLTVCMDGMHLIVPLHGFCLGFPSFVTGVRLPDGVFDQLPNERSCHPGGSGLQSCTSAAALAAAGMWSMVAVLIISLMNDTSSLLLLAQPAQLEWLSWLHIPVARHFLAVAAHQLP